MFNHSDNIRPYLVPGKRAHLVGIGGVSMCPLAEVLKGMGYKRILCAFQPHTYSRTKALFDQFVEELKIPDVAIVAEIFAAREKNTIGISSSDLCKQVPGSIYCSTLDQVTEELRKRAQPGDLILTVGAGDIYRAGEKLLEEQ